MLGTHGKKDLITVITDYYYNALSAGAMSALYSYNGYNVGSS